MKNLAWVFYFMLFLLPVRCPAQTVPGQLPVITQPPATHTESAPPVVDPMITVVKNSLQERLTKRVQEVNGWASTATEQIVIAVIVGVSGLLIGLLQKSSTRRTKALTVGVGFAISVITLCTNIIFPADYHAYQRAAKKAQPIIEELSERINEYALIPSPADRQTAEDYFKAQCGSIDEIAQTLLGDHAASDATLPNPTASLFLVAYAQSQPAAPPWTTAGKQPDTAFTYFVGQSSNASLTEAKNKSLDAAVDQAAHWLRGDMHSQSAIEPTPQLLDFARSSTSVADSWYTHDNSNGVYSYFTLLRVTNEFKGLNITGLDPEKELGSGIGGFSFGMTPQQVNALLPHPFGDVAALPVAGEFKTADVRYFWVNTAQFPPPDAHASSFEPMRIFQSCWESHNSYVTFLFTGNGLFRISTRFFWDCPNQITLGKDFAALYLAQDVSDNHGSLFRRVLANDSIDLSFSDQAVAVDVYKNGSPTP